MQMKVDSCHSKIEAPLNHRHILKMFVITSCQYSDEIDNIPLKMMWKIWTTHSSTFGNLKSDRSGNTAGDPANRHPSGPLLTTCTLLLTRRHNSTKLNFDSDWSPMPSKGEII